MGMGVGLSICHGIIGDHKGAIYANNAPEGGAVFTIRLPLMESGFKSAGAPENGRSDIKGNTQPG